MTPTMLDELARFVKAPALKTLNVLTRIVMRTRTRADPLVEDDTLRVKPSSEALTFIQAPAGLQTASKTTDAQTIIKPPRPTPLSVGETTQEPLKLDTNRGQIGLIIAVLFALLIAAGWAVFFGPLSAR